MGDASFKAELALLIPHLRAFGKSLTTRQDGDDLAQEAMMRAWRSRASYQPGTNMKAWVFMILRNHFISVSRRAWRTTSLDPTIAEDKLVANDDPSASEELADVRSAMQLLPHDKKEALILVGAAGLSYEETARICGCAIGTVKSRVSRARTMLAEILNEQAAGKRAKTDVSSSRVFDEIMADAASTQQRLELTA